MYNLNLKRNLATIALYLLVVDKPEYLSDIFGLAPTMSQDIFPKHIVQHPLFHTLSIPPL